MATKITLSEVLSIAGCSRHDFDNWTRRPINGKAFTFPPVHTRQGIPIQFDLRSALEVSFRAALARIGFPRRVAFVYAHDWVLAATAPSQTKHKWTRYALFVPTGQPFYCDKIGDDTLHAFRTSRAHSPFAFAPVFAAIDRGQRLIRMQALFTSVGQQVAA